MKSYVARRASLIAQMQAKGGGIAIIPTAPALMSHPACAVSLAFDPSRANIAQLGALGWPTIR